METKKREYFNLRGYDWGIAEKESDAHKPYAFNQKIRDEWQFIEQLVKDEVEKVYKSLGMLTPEEMESIKGKSVKELSIDELKAIRNEFDRKHILGWWRKSFKVSEMRTIKGTWYFKGYKIGDVLDAIESLESN